GTDLVLLEATKRRAAAGEETLGARKLAAPEPHREPDANTGRVDQARPQNLVREPFVPFRLQRKVMKVLPEVLDVGVVAPQPRRREREGVRDERPARRVQNLVARLSCERARQGRNGEPWRELSGPRIEFARPLPPVPVGPDIRVGQL